MDELLVSNSNAALIGDAEFRVRTEIKPVEMKADEWQHWLSSTYRQPGRWYEDDIGVPLSYHPGPYLSEKGETVALFEERIQPFLTFSDERFGLMVRAVCIGQMNSQPYVQPQAA